MMKFETLFKRNCLAWMLALPLLAACSASSDDVSDAAPSTGAQIKYIRLAVTVQDEDTRTRKGDGTRAGGSPTGDGKQTGLTRENEIKGVTLFLMPNNILESDNTLSPENRAKLVSYVFYAPVTRVSSSTHNENDACYETGDVRLPDDFDASQNYSALAVANLNLESMRGRTLGELWDATLDRHHLAQAEDGANSAGVKFFTMTPSGPDTKPATLKFIDSRNISTGIASGNTIKFDFRNNSPLGVMRTMARIDFWTECCDHKVTYQEATDATGDYIAKEGDYTDAIPAGYKYEIDELGNYFILEDIAPFNLYDGPTYAIQHLKKEDGLWKEDFDANGNPAGNWKPVYFNQLTNTARVLDTETPFKYEGSGKNPMYRNPLGMDVLNGYYKQTTKDLHVAFINQVAGSEIGLTPDRRLYTKDNVNEEVIITYAIENGMLDDASLLKKFATGVALRGSYFNKLNHKINQKTFYFYLRTQDNLPNYTLKATELTQANLDADDRIATDDTGMIYEYNTLRNNIYRIHIDKVNAQTGQLEVTITANPWREVQHPEINL